MKQFRVTAIFAILLAALIAYIFMVDDPKQAEKKTNEEREKKVSELASRDIKHIILSNALAQEPITLAKTDTGWKIIEPIQTDADQTTMEGLVSTIEGIRISQVIDENPGDLSVYGLMNPLLTINFGANIKSSKTLIFGDINKVNSSLYFKTADSPRVMTTNSYLKASISKTLFDLRDKRIFVFDDSNLTSLSFKHGDGTELALTNDDGDWRITKPHAWDADDNKIRQLLSTLRGLRATAFKPDAQEAGVSFEKPDLTIAIDLGSNKESQIGYIVTNDSEDDYIVWAMKAGSDWVYEVAADSIGRLTKDPVDLRETKVTNFNRYTVNAMTVSRGNGKRFILRKVEDASPDQWEITTFADDGSPRVTLAIQSAVDTLITTIESMESEELIDAHGNYGLGETEAVTISGTGRENKPVFSIIIGKAISDEDGGRYVRNSNKPQIFRVSDASSVNTAPEDYTETTPAPPPVTQP